MAQFEKSSLAPKIQKLADGTMTASEIAQILKCSPKTVESYVRYAPEYSIKRIPRKPQASKRAGWTDERIEILKTLWAEGLSSSQIASRLGGVTRNAVIGKIHRLGLQGRVTKKNGLPPKPPRPRKKAAPKPLGNPAFRKILNDNPEPFAPAEEEIFIPLAERKSLLDLGPSDCRWPIGDPQHDDFHFCGMTKANGLPYCKRHALRAFEPPKPRQRKPQGLMSRLEVKNNAKEFEGA